MVVGGDRHADRDDDGPVPRDARHRALVVVAKMILDILFSRLVGWFSAPFKVSVSAVSCVVLDKGISPRRSNLSIPSSKK